MQAKIILTDPSSPYVRVINGMTFIDAVALEESIDPMLPAKDRLRQKMIHAGVTFWNEAKTIVKKPVIGISAVGSFSVCLEGNPPEGMINVRFGDQIVGPFTPSKLADGLRVTMGIQSSHTYMNPKGKNARTLYDLTAEHGHFSMAHAATLGIHCLGITKQAELELNVQRDLLYLARETSARSACQDEPTLVAFSAAGAVRGEKIMQVISEQLTQLEKTGNASDWREERNGLYPLNTCVSLGMSSDLRNLQKIIKDIGDVKGKEQEYRNILALLNDSLNGLFPELFLPTSTFSHQYPEIWSNKTIPAPSIQGSEFGFFQAAKPVTNIPKNTILLLGAPGVGKSTQTERIMQQLPGVMCVSTGNLVRKLKAKKTLGEQPLTAIEAAAAASLDKMERGELMDDKPVYDLLMAHLSPGGEGYAEYTKAHTLILDGVIKEERNIAPFNEALNAYNLDKRVMPMGLTKVINISASQEELNARQLSRVTQALAAGVPQRPDDDIQVYRRRLEKYSRGIVGALKYYQDHQNFIEIDSSKGMEQTTQDLISAIQEPIATNSPRL